MANEAGVVKSVTGGGVRALNNITGEVRNLNAGDIVYQNEKITTDSSNSKVIITQTDGKDITLLGKDTITLDQSASNNESFGNETVADISALQQAILNGTDLNALEETAAGGGAAGGGDGVSLSATSFTEGGHISNVNANYGNLPDNTNNYTINSAPTSTAIGGVAENDNSQPQPQPEPRPRFNINITSLDDTMEGGEMIYSLSLPTTLTSRPTTLNLSFSGGVAGVDYDPTTIEYSTDGGNSWTRGTTVNLADANQINNVQVRVQTTDNYGLDGVDVAHNPTQMGVNQNQGEQDGSNYSDVNGVEYGIYKRKLTLNVTTDNEEIANSQADGKIIDNDDYVNINEGLSETVFTGSGDDTVNMRGRFSDVYSTVITEDGDDVINVKSGAVLNYGNAQIDAGDGNDTINLDKGSLIGNNGYSGTRIYGGDGNDTFNMNGDVDGGALYGDGGNDTFNLGSTGVLKNGSIIYANGGDDIINIGGTVQEETQILGDEGYDTITIKSGGVVDNSLIYADDQNEDIYSDIGNEINIYGTVKNNSSVYGGAGVDTVNINGTVEDSYINTRSGGDFITMTGGKVKNSKIDTGTGDDEVDMRKGSITNDTEIYTREGVDTVNIDGKFVSETKKTKVETGSGDDIINVSGEVIGNMSIGGEGQVELNTDSGNDTVNINKGAKVSFTSIDTGLGNDDLNITGDKDNVSSTVLNNVNVNLEKGVDNVKIENATLHNVAIDTDDNSVDGKTTVDVDNSHLDRTKFYTGDDNDTINIRNTVIKDDESDQWGSTIRAEGGDDTVNIESSNISGKKAEIDTDNYRGEHPENDGNDTLNIKDTTINSIRFIKTGGGDDTVHVTNSTISNIDDIDGLTGVNLGEGNNTITFDGNSKLINTNLGAGAGNDEISMTNGTKITNSNILMGDGINTLNITRDSTEDNSDINLNSVKIQGGADRDEVNISDTTGESKVKLENDTSINLGDGNNEVTIDGKVQLGNIENPTKKIITTGSGRDIITLQNGATMEGRVIETGEGNDHVNVFDGASLNFAKIETGKGDDVVRFDHLTANRLQGYSYSAATDTKINMGDGRDTLVVYGMGNKGNYAGRTSDFQQVNVDMGDNGVKTVQMYSSKIETTNITTGSADDLIEIKHDSLMEGRNNIETGVGADTVKILDSKIESLTRNRTDKTTINTGDGDDNVIIENSKILSQDQLHMNEIKTGDGEDTVDIKGDSVLKFAKIDTGDGGDTVNIGGEFFASYAHTKEGNDIINVNGQIKGWSEIDAGEGEDEITINSGAKLYDGTSIYGNNGDDTITLKSGIEFIADRNGSFINGGEGNDTFVIEKVADINKDYLDEAGHMSGRVQIYGGNGTDTLKIMDDSASLDFSKTNIISIEKIELGDDNKNVTLSAKNILDITKYENSASHILDILGDGNDKVDLKGSGFTRLADYTDGNGKVWRQYSATNTDNTLDGISHTVTIRVEDGVTVDI